MTASASTARTCAASAAARRATLIRCGPTRRSCGRTHRRLITLRSASCCCCVVVVTRTFGVALRKLVVPFEGCLDMKECSIYPPALLCHGWHARPGTSSSLPTTAEHNLSHLLAAHRPAPVRSRVANSLIRGAEWLITRLHKFDSYEKRARSSARTHCSKAAAVAMRCS